jgi:CPA1 family monovalent cation:H+ antiporter
MINDAVALVSYKVAVVAVVTGTLTAGEAIDDLVIGVIGGVAIGLAVSGISQMALRRLDDAPLAILLTVFTAYASFALADGVGASGVLAAVSSGLFSGWRSHIIFDADLRLNAQSFWRVLVFALNAILFVLVGEQFPEILRKVGETFSPGEIVGYGLMISAVVIFIRVAWQFLPVSLGRLLPALGDTGGGENWRERLLIGWSGMRGAVSLAAALALPLTLDSGETFGSRDLIVYLTVAVIFVTLVGQGLTLPRFVKALRLSTSEPWAADEAVARLAAAQAALDRLDELESEGSPVSESAVERLRELYQARFARCVAALQGDDSEIPIENPLSGYRRLREDLIKTERDTLLGMRKDGRIKQDLFRRIQRDLDLDEARLGT